ncbi:MAG TPA: alpha/beta hydrolase [Opitutales bacterium]|nr:alpha/beta hydrolase [Opitutales bacterium]
MRTIPVKASWQARAISAFLRTFKRRHTLIERAGAAGLYVRATRNFVGHLARFFPYRRAGLRFHPAPGAPVPAEWIIPLDAVPKRTLLFLHGGGYLMCSPRTHRTLTTFFARQFPARVLAPAYRLAPENQFPAALDDVTACYRWLRAQGIPAKEIVLAGDSAGGGLLLGLLLRLRDAGEALPAAAACLSPWTDLAATGDSLVTNTFSEVFYYGESVAIAAKLYLGPTPSTHPLASPLYADLHGLPPLIIHASDSEGTRDDSVRFAAKARAAGVPVQFKLWPGLPHVWQAFLPFIPEARASLDEIVEFLKNPPVS